MFHFSPHHTGVQQNNEHIAQIFKILTQPYPIIVFLLISKLQSFVTWLNLEFLLKIHFFFTQME
jgi:hypothetical protein